MIAGNASESRTGEFSKVPRQRVPAWLVEHVNRFVSCICIDEYKNRGLVAPDCQYHDFLDALADLRFGGACESCGQPAQVTLGDGSSWCMECHAAALNLGYDDDRGTLIRPCHHGVNAGFGCNTCSVEAGMRVVAAGVSYSRPDDAPESAYSGSSYAREASS